MFFVTAIRSAAGAANYFAKDNYYTQGRMPSSAHGADRGQPPSALPASSTRIPSRGS
jgi:hypothetical protein